MRINKPLPSNLLWVKSTSSAAGDCVEVAATDGRVAVRDSKDRQGPVILYTKREWRAFLEGVRKGEFDRFIQP